MQFRVLVSLFWCLLLSGNVRGQAVYSGRVGTASIELVLEDYEPAVAIAGIYVYTKHNSPIAVSGRLENKVLTLTEKDAHGKPAATLKVPVFDLNAASVTGTWKSLATGRELPLTLTRKFVLGDGSAKEYELLQAASLASSYFQLVVDSSTAVSGLKLRDKKTGRLLQRFEVDCQFRGVHNVSVGDYNFDGLADFAVFESSYAGPNTSSLYYLYDPVHKRYVASSFSGVSLEFDAKKKRIYEQNSCCAGSSVTTAEYKVVRNQMVLLAEHCYKWDEKQQKLVERKPSACQ